MLIRIVQGLALGGEYGGAAVYVAEHVPDNKRGYTAIGSPRRWAICVAAGHPAGARRDADGYLQQWGWRPFLLSSSWWAFGLHPLEDEESPLFTKLKSRTSTSPIKDSFGTARSWRTFFLVLLGAAAGQAVVWYTGQFYVNTWMKSALKINATTADTIVAIALALGMPFFVVMGALSDRIGRKKVMMTGNLLAALRPVFLGISPPPNVTPEVKDAAGKIDPGRGAANRDDHAADLPDAAVRDDGVRPDRRLPGRTFGGSATPRCVPYHFGNGYFGGWCPYHTARSPAPAIFRHQGSLGVAAMTFIIGMLFLKETNHVSILTRRKKPTRRRPSASADSAHTTTVGAKLPPPSFFSQLALLPWQAGSRQALCRPRRKRSPSVTATDTISTTNHGTGMRNSIDTP